MGAAGIHRYTFCLNSGCGEQVVVSALTTARKRFDGKVWQLMCPHCDREFQARESDLLQGVFTWSEENGRLKQAG